MPTLDPSPRPTKRQRTTSDDSSLPFTSRVLRTVKQAVYGKPSVPKINDIFSERKFVESGEDDAPRRGVKNTPGRKSNSRHAPPQRPGRTNAESTLSMKPTLRKDVNDEIDELNGDLDSTSSTRKSEGRGKVNETITSLRQKQGLRKQLPETEDDIDEETDLGFGKISTREGSVDDLAHGHQTDELDHAQSEDTPTGKSRKKRKNLVPAIANGDSSLVCDDARLQSDHEKALKELLENEPDVLPMLQARILESLTGKRQLPLVNIESEYRKVHRLVEQTVLAGEGNSMLIVGSRGSGKTTLVETVI